MRSIAAVRSSGRNANVTVGTSSVRPGILEPKESPTGFDEEDSEHVRGCHQLGAVASWVPERDRSITILLGTYDLYTKRKREYKGIPKGSKVQARCKGDFFKRNEYQRLNLNPKSYTLNPRP